MSAVETRDELLFSGLTDLGQPLDQDTCEKLMSLQATGKPAVCSQPAPQLLFENSRQQVSASIAAFLQGNQRLFNEERERLERWADDKLQAAEDALRDTKARIAQLRRDARNAATLQEQEGIQRELADQERKQRRQRQDIFVVEDEIIEQRDALIDSLQQRLQEKTEQETLFTLRWRVV